MVCSNLKLVKLIVKGILHLGRFVTTPTQPVITKVCFDMKMALHTQHHHHHPSNNDNDSDNNNKNNNNVSQLLFI